MYSPIAFGKKWDPEGTFVRKYVPELKDLDDKYVYEPWKAPKVDLKNAKVELMSTEDTMAEVRRFQDGSHDSPPESGTGQYPRPIFDFSERRAFCLDAMKKAYNINLYGNDPKVLDGSWKELFENKSTAPAKKSKVTEDDNEAGEKVDDNAGGRKKRKDTQKTLDGALTKRKKIAT